MASPTFDPASLRPRTWFDAVWVQPFLQKWRKPFLKHEAQLIELPWLAKHKREKGVSRHGRLLETRSIAREFLEWLSHGQNKIPSPSGCPTEVDRLAVK